jgi:DNA-directed RNA polymerase subunit RPC12/RpoP
MQKDIEEAKTKARRLRELLASKGMDLGQSEALETLAALEGLADWNQFSASLAKRPADSAMFCPHCGHRGKVQEIGVAKLQQGPWLVDNYMFEGDASQYVCLSCNGQFVDWNSGILFRNQHHLVAVISEDEEGRWSIEALSAIDAARALQVEDWGSLTEQLKRVNGAQLLHAARWAVAVCEPCLEIEGASRTEVCKEFYREIQSPVLTLLEY